MMPPNNSQIMIAVEINPSFGKLQETAAKHRSSETTSSPGGILD
jgi:hypothetical protein